MTSVLAKFIPLTAILKRHWHVIALTILFIPAVWGLLQPGYFPMHDDLQVFRLYEFHKCILDLQIPCRWVPDAGFGYGYPLMQFYPPMPYYPMEILHVLGLGYFWPVKIMFALAFIVSGLGMFYLAKTFFGQWGGIISAMLYVYSPYHSVDVYVRGAMNEAWGMAWFPFVLLYIYKVIRQNNKRDYLYLALFLSLQLTSHNVMTMVFAPTAIIWAIFNLLVSKNFSKFKELVFSGLLGIGLASFFFIPVVLEQKHVHVDSMIVGYFNYLAHYADLNQLFFSRFWGYGGSTWGPEDGMSFSVGQLQWLAALLALILSASRIKKNFQEFFMVAMFFMFGLGYAFLTHSKSVFFWDNISLLQFSQFPWRLVALIVLYFSLAGGYLASLQVSKNFGKVLIPLGCLAILFWNINFFRAERQILISLPEKMSGRQWELQVTGGIFDYLPRSAPKPPGDPGFTIPKYVEGNGGILDYQSGSNWQEFTANVSSPSAQIMIPLYVYPGLTVKVDGKNYQYGQDLDLGRVTLNLSSGLHKVSLQIGYTTTRLISDLITIASVIIFIYMYKNAGKRN